MQQGANDAGNRAGAEGHATEWRPGRPVVNDADRAEWMQWRAERKRQQQRDRRARYPRIDYYPTAEAYELIRSLSGPHLGGDFSSVISRVVVAWAENCHRNKKR